MLQKSGKETTELRQEIAELKTQVAEMKENIKSKANTKNELKKTVPKDISVSLFGMHTISLNQAHTDLRPADPWFLV